MLANNVVWQGLLDGLGWVLARIYDVIPNYGVSIIVLTLLIRLILLPLGIKQIKQMQTMQAISPKIKEIQKKYKGNRERIQEEQMKIYREYGASPLGGCLPMLLTYPFLIAMYSVVRPAPYAPVKEDGQVSAYELYGKVHVPTDSELFAHVIVDQDDGFLLMHMQCALLQAGKQAPIYSAGRPLQQQQAGLPRLFKATPIDSFVSAATRNCGTKRFPDVIPYVILLAAMVASTFFAQLQMQRSSPPGSASQQQKTLTRLFPLMFAVFGLQFASGLVLYWVVQNSVQIGQQTFLLRAGHIGPEAMERRIAENRAKAQTQPPKKSWLARQMEKAEGSQAQKQRERNARQQRPAKPQRGGQGGRSNVRSGGPNRPKKKKPK